MSSWQSLCESRRSHTHKASHRAVSALRSLTANRWKLDNRRSAINSALHYSNCGILSCTGTGRGSACSPQEEGAEVLCAGRAGGYRELHPAGAASPPAERVNCQHAAQTGDASKQSPAEIGPITSP